MSKKKKPRLKRIAPKRAVRCAEIWERRGKGQRYVLARGQCKRVTAHPSGYCSAHRYGYRWSDAQEAAYQRSKTAGPVTNVQRNTRGEK